MATSIRVQKVASLLQQSLGAIFLQGNVGLNNVMITVTEVSVSPDLGLAKVHLSFLRSEDNEKSLAQIKAKKGTIRRLLGNQVGNKLRKVPDLQFFEDTSAENATKMHRLLDEL